MRPENDDPARIRTVFLFVVAIATTLLFFWVIEGFFVALLLAAILAGMGGPTFRRLTGWFGGRQSPAAALTVLLTLLVVIVPVLLLMGVLLGDAVHLSQELRPWVEAQVEDPGSLERAMAESPILRELLPYQDEIVQKVGQLAGKVAGFAAQALVGTVTGAANFFLMLFVVLFAMYSFLKNGKAIVDQLFAFTPLTRSDRERLVTTFNSVAKATLQGTVVIGIVQGGLAGAAFAVVGIENAVFWAAIMTVLSILPGIGTALVWVPAVGYLAMTDRTGAAIGLALWCALVVGTIDNVLRPMLVGGNTKMPELLILLTTLGGLALFGIVGLALGPVVGALFMTIWSLWEQAMSEAGHSPEPELQRSGPGTDEPGAIA